MILDCIEVEESRSRYALLLEDSMTCATLRIIWEEPGSADRDHAGRGGNPGRSIFCQCIRELFGRNYVGGERDVAGL